jgi:glucose/arabinose dehydrogenase
LPEWGINYDKGVIYRIDAEGNPITTNPFFANSTLSKYFAYGIRNGYGIAVDPITDSIWDSENGDNDFDEINLVFPGFNSGYQKIQGPSGKGEWSSPISELTYIEGSQYSEPEFSWKNAVGLTAIEFLNSKIYGTVYENDMFVGDAYGNLYHLKLNHERTGFVFSDTALKDLIVDTPQEGESIIFGKNLGLITDIKTGPDGYLYILSMIQTDRPGWIQFMEGVEGTDVKKLGTMQGVIFRIIPSSNESVLDGLINIIIENIKEFLQFVGLKL